MTYTDCRKRLRAILAGPKCVSPVTVFDALSARTAESVGAEVGILSGSVSAGTVIAAPDIVLQTLTEFADQVRRIMRVSRLSLVVDADHGYGNALSAMRTVEELEHAGVSGLMIEDIVMPARFGTPGVEIVSVEEMVGKLRAALLARQDPSLVIIGRIAALKAEDAVRAAARARAYAATGVDAIFLTGLKTLQEFDAIRAATDLPIICGTTPSIKREDLAARGVRLLLQGHQPVAVAVKALRQAYALLLKGGAPAELASAMASPEEMAEVLHTRQYDEWARRFLLPPS
jgi:oxaloacetate decarboxylase